MNRIPPVLRAQLAKDPFMKVCVRAYDGNHAFTTIRACKGRITWEHALTYAGKQVQEAWAILPLCEFHHLGPGLNKHINIRIAIRRATPGDLARYPRNTWGSQAKPKPFQK